MATLLLSSLDTLAAQILHGRPDETLTASISRSEPTLIRIDGRQIRRIFGVEGDFVVTPDKESGTAYLKPTTDKQAISVFVSDDSGRTWKLVLLGVDGPSDTIVIKPKKEGKNAGGAGRDASRNQIIKRVILALDSAQDAEMELRETNDIVPLWKEAMFVRKMIVDGSGFTGEKYLLTNVSSAEMVIDERELYRPGVVAVAIEKPVIKPAETTTVYVVSEGE